MRYNELIETNDSPDMATILDVDTRKAYNLRLVEELITRWNPLAMDKILNDVLILRGGWDIDRYGRDINGLAYAVDPPENRRSAYAIYNYYTLYMSNADEWADVPRRDSSHICTTGLAKMKKYGRGWVVIPDEPSTVIAMASQPDIWDSFDTKFNLDTWNIRLHDMLGFSDDEAEEMTWESMRDRIDAREDRNPDIAKHLEMLSPGKIKLTSYQMFNEKTTTGMGKEIWFSEPALYVPLYAIRQLQELHGVNI